MTNTYPIGPVPWLFHLYFAWIRRTPDVWMGLPSGIKVPRSRWKDGTWKLLCFKRIIAHEASHVQRIRQRPFFSRYGWLIRYYLSWQMRLEEESYALMQEVGSIPPGEVPAQFTAWAEDLVNFYGVKLTVAQVRKELSIATLIHHGNTLWMDSLFCVEERREAEKYPVA